MRKASLKPIGEGVVATLYFGLVGYGARVERGRIAKRQKLGWRDAKTLGDNANVLQANVPLPSLNAAHVTAVQTYFMGERFLTPAALAAKLSDAVAEKSFNVHFIHTHEHRTLTPILPRVISTRPIGFE
jgi:hypothetical protein